jgi:omega-6 fatty acid desaturase (delta-12 desaturase)
MPKDSKRVRPKASRPEWYSTLSTYEEPSLGKAIWQLTNTLVPYFLLWFVMLRTVQLGYSYWLTLALSVLAGGLLVRIFIFFHDCGHGSFFASRRANTILGYLTGFLTFTPYHEWSYSHSQHHAAAGNLDRRGVGDVWTMTVAEYLAAPKAKRFAYRFMRNPLVTFGLGPAYMFLIAQRFAHKHSKKRQRFSVHLTNLVLLAIVSVAALSIGLKTYVLVQLPILLIGGAAGVWLFYVQHQFRDVYWARQEDWDPIKAAMEGSSYYKLPKVLRWFTGNIGFHHIHHLKARIPNYNLRQCYDQVPAMQTVKPLTIRQSLGSAFLDLWDEEGGRLVSFRALQAQPHDGAI